MDVLYLDHAATTALRADVFDAMRPHLTGPLGNPSSSHRVGRAAAKAVEDARARVADALGAHTDEVYFVRGGTEADNLVVQGMARSSAAAGPLVISAFEHPAVAATADAQDRPTLRIPVHARGGFDMDVFVQSLSDDPCLVAVMWVNNETGDVQPIQELAEACASRGVPFHTDAVQAVGRVPVRLDELPVSFLALSAHKLGGPQGTGVLFVRRGHALPSLLHGGKQERGLRPGTTDVAGAVGASVAVAAAVRERPAQSERLTAFRHRLETAVLEAVPGARVHGIEDGDRAPHILNIGVPGPDRTVLLAALDTRGLAVSGGAACSSGGSGPSPVIEALYGADHPLTAIRFSLSSETTREDVDRAAEIVTEVLGPGGVLASEARVP